MTDMQIEEPQDDAVEPMDHDEADMMDETPDTDGDDEDEEEQEDESQA